MRTNVFFKQEKELQKENDPFFNLNDAFNPLSLIHSCEEDAETSEILICSTLKIRLGPRLGMRIYKVRYMPSAGDYFE